MTEAQIILIKWLTNQCHIPIHKIALIDDCSVEAELDPDVKQVFTYLDGYVSSFISKEHIRKKI